jgi:gamma-glutamyl hercynylcysteine S-oxide synthase
VKARAAAADPLVGELDSARRFLTRALSRVPDELWNVQVSPSYSPTGWHVGHVAAVQERWLLPGEEPRYGALFDPVAVDKPARVTLPEPAALKAYLDEVLQRVREGLERGRTPGILGLPETFLVQHVAQHELQHAEHAQVIHALHEKRLHKMPPPMRAHAADRLEFSARRWIAGCPDGARAYDNERPQHEVELPPYWLDRAPVSAGQFVEFVREGGYRSAGFWTSEGWEWREKHNVRSPVGLREQDKDAPVTCLSWYEADAYARWRGARLPLEHELEAAGVTPCGVWEWTSSWFVPYPGFRAYPYQGYSVPWFGTHRVLRGGSWATSEELMRPSLRNWYEPGFRELPSGFRCAGDLS